MPLVPLGIKVLLLAVKIQLYKKSDIIYEIGDAVPDHDTTISAILMSLVTNHHSVNNCAASKYLQGLFQEGARGTFTPLGFVLNPPPLDLLKS